MTITPLSLPEVLRITPRVFRDERGFFLETHHQLRYAEGGIGPSFVQDNHSCSAVGTLRGLHAQLVHPQGKLVRCIAGEIYDVAVDIRRGSPTFGRWCAAVLSSETLEQLWIPPGYAHAFCVTRGPAQVEYKCTALYDRDDEIAIAWNDPAIGIEWPIEHPVLSPRDRSGAPLADLIERLPVWPATAATVAR